MEYEPGISSSRSNSKFSWENLSPNLLLAFQSVGVVYGDLSTSPIFVYTSTFKGRQVMHLTEDTIFGAFSLIFWTLTLLPLLKYSFFVLSADDNGEGGTLALYSVLCRHAKFSLLPNQQAADEELSTYSYGNPTPVSGSCPLKKLLDKHKNLHIALLLFVLIGAAMVIGDGVLTPAISGLSSVSGLRVAERKLNEAEVVVLASIILVGLFALQHYGTHKVAFLFAPIIVIWLFSILGIGLYNVINWNPKIVQAFSRHYIVKYFKKTGKDGWVSLGGVLLCITGTEAMFADIGHFTAVSVKLAFTCVIYPCLVVQYLGQAAFLSKNPSSIEHSFYHSIPRPVYWPVYVFGTLAAIVASQGIITATFSIVKQCQSLGCFPRVKIVHTSNHMYGQIYIPEINWILMILTLAVTIGFRDTTMIGNAYGLACISVMLITTGLMALILTFVWRRGVLAIPIFTLFGLIEGVYLSSAFIKVPQGGWVPIMFSLIIVLVMYVWRYGTQRKYNFELENKVSLKWILGLGPSLGIVRVPSIGLIYSELTVGVPAIFSHFVTNFPAFHQVLVFVCLKSVPVPYVSPEERFLIGRICPRPYGMYRCIVRYGYKDIAEDYVEFENMLIKSVAEFTQMEAVESQSTTDGSSNDGRMVVVSSRSLQDSSSLIISEHDDSDINETTQSSLPMTQQSLRSIYEDEGVQSKRRRVRFQLPQSLDMDPDVKDELLELIEAKEAGVAYIIGHSYVKAKRSSSFLKKLVIDIGYSFISNNCRGSSVALNIPHISLIEVGMIYYV